MQGMYVKLCCKHFLPHPFQLLFIDQPIIQHCIISTVEWVVKHPKERSTLPFTFPLTHTLSSIVTLSVSHSDWLSFIQSQWPTHQHSHSVTMIHSPTHSFCHNDPLTHTLIHCHVFWFSQTMTHTHLISHIYCHGQTRSCYSHTRSIKRQICPKVRS